MWIECELTVHVVQQAYQKFSCVMCKVSEMWEYFVYNCFHGERGKASMRIQHRDQISFTKAPNESAI